MVIWIARGFILFILGSSAVGKQPVAGFANLCACARHRFFGEIDPNALTALVTSEYKKGGSVFFAPFSPASTMLISRR
jgi:hypothetical protein